MPKKGTLRASGFDLCAWLCDNWVTDQYPLGHIVVNPGERQIIKTGLNFIIPEGHEVQIRPRSGLAAKNGIMIVNSPGTVDQDFSGVGENYEIKVILYNSGDLPLEIKHGDRIAQAVLMEVPDVELIEITDNEEFTGDRTGGFGSTGV
jgi:dUTP pyrophosphatase